MEEGQSKNKARWYNTNRIRLIITKSWTKDKEDIIYQKRPKQSEKVKIDEKRVLEAKEKWIEISKLAKKIEFEEIKRLEYSSFMVSSTSRSN